MCVFILATVGLCAKQTKLLFYNLLSLNLTTGVWLDMFALLLLNALTPRSHHYDLTLETHPTVA